MSQAETTHSASVEQLQKLHRRRMTIFGSIILIAGIAIGSASTVILMPHKEPVPPGDPTWLAKMMTDRLERVLDLTKEQKDKIRDISRTAFTAIREIQEVAKPEIETIIKNMNADIAKVLTEEQNVKWQRDIEEFKKRFRDRWRRGGRRPGEGGPRPDHRRGPGDPNRDRRGPDGWRPDDPNRPWRGFGPGDPNRPREGFRRGPGQFGPGFGPDDPNRPPGDFDREAMRERYRRGERPRPDEPPRPPVETITEGETKGE